ncbi:MAG: PAS domain-containing protein [Eubacterium sp.]|nr:PAS domain-containing protein [Eubacterium sp.]
MNCEVDKADNLKVVSCDNHFSEFTGVHPSKIKQGKLYLNDIINPKNRENVRRVLNKKDSPYVYLDFYIEDKNGKNIYVYCTGSNIKGTTLCRLTLVDVSRSQKMSQALKTRADEMNALIDLVNAGVCLFKVTSDMEFEALYLNEACCRLFGTQKKLYKEHLHKLDDLIYNGDKSEVFQAVGKALATKKPIDMEIRVITHKDEYVWCKFLAGFHRYDTDGSPIFHAIFSDINAVKRAEEDADEERDLLIRVFKNLPGALFTADFDAPFILDVVSSDFMKFIGFSRTELFEDFGGDLTNLMLEREVPVARHSLITSSKDSNVAKAIYTIRTKSGRHIIVSDRRRIVERENGRKVTIGSLMDVTQLKSEETFDI